LPADKSPSSSVSLQKLQFLCGFLCGLLHKLVPITFLSHQIKWLEVS
jgi:hypothetical protein